MPDPSRIAIAQLAREAKKASMPRLAVPETTVAMKSPPPPPPPKPSAPAHAQQWRHPQQDQWDRRVHEYAKRSGMVAPPEEGMVRLYRAGSVPADSPPRSPDDVINGPFGPLTRGELDAMKGTAHSNPFGAEGRWFTDEPKELDFYIRENDADPVYFVDLPQDAARTYNVANTPYAKNSRNPEREFVLPDEALSRARRLLDGLLERRP